MHQAEDAKEMLSKGYQLLQLEGHDVVVEQQHDTRALLAWGPQGILLSFRGTASFQNFVSDLRVRDLTFHQHFSQMRHALSPALCINETSAWCPLVESTPGPAAQQLVRQSVPFEKHAVRCISTTKATATLLLVQRAGVLLKVSGLFVALCWRWSIKLQQNQCTIQGGTRSDIARDLCNPMVACCQSSWAFQHGT